MHREHHHSVLLAQRYVRVDEDENLAQTFIQPLVLRFPIPRVGLKAHDDRGAGGFTCVGWEEDDTRERVRVRICVRVGKTGGGGMYVRGTYLIRFCCSSRWVGFLGDLSVLSLSTCHLFASPGQPSVAAPGILKKEPYDRSQRCFTRFTPSVCGAVVRLFIPVSSSIFYFFRLETLH